MSKHAVGYCRSRADYTEEGLPPRLAWELAICRAKPPYPKYEQVQPDPRHGEETRRRVESMQKPLVQQYDWHCEVAFWMRVAAVLGVLGACAAFWCWVSMGCVGRYANGSYPSRESIESEDSSVSYEVNFCERKGGEW